MIPRTPAELVTLICPCCGNTFIRARADDVYCRRPACHRKAENAGENYNPHSKRPKAVIAARVEALYRYLVEYIGENGRSPSEAEITAALPDISAGSSSHYIGLLEKAGRIRAESCGSGKRRKISLVERRAA